MQIKGAEIKWSLVVRARAIDTPALRPCGRSAAWAGRGKRLGLVSPAHWVPSPPRPPRRSTSPAPEPLAGVLAARHTSLARPHRSRQICGHRRVNK